MEGRAEEFQNSCSPHFLFTHRREIDRFRKVMKECLPEKKKKAGVGGESIVQGQKGKATSAQTVLRHVQICSQISVCSFTVKPQENSGIKIRHRSESWIFLFSLEYSCCLNQAVFYHSIILIQTALLPLNDDVTRILCFFWRQVTKELASTYP